VRSRDRGRRPRASSTAGMWDKSSSKLPHAARVAVRCMLHAHTAARSRTCGGWWPCGRRAERTSGLGRGLDGEMLSAAASARRAQSPPRIPSGRRTWPSPQEGEAWHRGRAAGPLCEPYSPCAAVPLPFGAPRASAPPADNAGQSRSAWPGLGLSGRRWQGSHPGRLLDRLWLLQIVDDVRLGAAVDLLSRDWLRFLLQVVDGVPCGGAVDLGSQAGGVQSPGLEALLLEHRLPRLLLLLLEPRCVRRRVQSSHVLCTSFAGEARAAGGHLGLSFHFTLLAPNSGRSERAVGPEFEKGATDACVQPPTTPPRRRGAPGGIEGCSTAPRHARSYSQLR